LLVALTSTIVMVTEREVGFVNIKIGDGRDLRQYAAVLHFRSVGVLRFRSVGVLPFRSAG
jgi:hypothetical protein